MLAGCRLVLKSRQRFALFAWLLFVFVLAFVSPVSLTGSDPHFSLVVSQAIWDHHTLQLDEYLPAMESQVAQFGYQIAYHGGHAYYAYPLGTSLLSVPFVAAASLLGQDMTVPADNYRLQNLLSALLCVTLAAVTYRIGRCYVASLPSLLISGVSVLGSMLISTMATALWSVDLAVTLISVGVLVLASHDSGRTKHIDPYVLGAVLFAAFLCRPTSAIFAGLAVVYVLAVSRRQGFELATLLALLLGGFAWLSWIHYGQPLPPYYSAGQWLRGGQFGTALYGVLASPSRGLLVYCPFYAVILVAVILRWRELRRSRLLWLALLWICLHAAVVASTPMWWGGYSYGPRLMAEVAPAFSLLAFAAWRSLSTLPRARSSGALSTAYVALGLVGVLINGFQGLFNLNTVQWNVTPSIDQHPEYLFDWSYPQFLATADGSAQRYLTYSLQALATGELALTEYPLGSPLAYDDTTHCLFIGWWSAGPGEWWSETRSASIVIRLGSVDPQATYRLAVVSGSLGFQPVEIALNGSVVGAVSFSGPTERQAVAFSGALLEPHDTNVIQLRLPRAASPGLSDICRLGLRYAPHRLALRSTVVVIEPSGPT